MLSLFLTLFARLWYVQVSTGEAYQAQAADQSVRELVVQPARGPDRRRHGAGRWSPTARAGWSASTGPSSTGSTRPTGTRCCAGSPHVVGSSYAAVKARSLRCGEHGADPDTCWNGSPYQPVPVAEDVAQTKAVQILEQPEDFPSVLAEAQSVRSYPSPFKVNAAHLLGYLSPITESELSKAQAHDDSSVNAASTVGRSGLEQTYDKWLRGVPGYKRVTVDSQGRVLGDDSELSATPGSTLVTSIDARLQGVVERNLHDAITTARGTYDKVTHKNYVADSGAAVVLDAKTGQVVSMASQPTYDPSEWVGGITAKQLARLYSKQAGTPLISRATQGQFAPGSTFKPFMTVGAFNNGYDAGSQLNCSSGLQVGNRWFKNYESESYGSIDFAQALQVSCDTFFYRVGLGFWQKYGSDPAERQRQGPAGPLRPATSGWAARPASTCLARRPGRIADRKWKLAYFKAMKPYYCKIDRTRKQNDFLKLFAHEFCAEGNLYRAGDAVNFSIGQGDTTVTPLQLATAYAAISNGGTLYAPAGGQGDRLAERYEGHQDPEQGHRPHPDAQGRSRLRRQRPARAPPRSARWPGSSTASRSTRCRCAARPAPPRCRASRAPRGSRRTTRTTW